MDDYIETKGDLHVKHEGTYVGYIDDKTEKTIKLLGFEDNEDGDYLEDNPTILCKYVDLTDSSSSIKTVLWEELEPNLILEYPNMGAINYKNSVVCVARKLKQESPTKYRKTFRAGSFLTFDPNLEDRKLLDLESIPINLNNTLINTIASSIIFNEYLSHDESLERVLGFTNIGSAFSSLYYYTLNFHGNQVSLWRDNNIIGKYNHKSKLTDLNNDYFTNELEDLGLKIGDIYED